MKTKTPKLRDVEQAARHRFPMLFDPKHPLVLEVGVHAKLAAALGISIRISRQFLRRWTGSTPYLIAVTKDAKRHNLQGDPVEIISASDKEAATERLDGRKSKTRRTK